MVRLVGGIEKDKPVGGFPSPALPACLCLAFIWLYFIVFADCFTACASPLLYVARHITICFASRMLRIDEWQFLGVWGVSAFTSWGYFYPFRGERSPLFDI